MPKGQRIKPELGILPHRDHRFWSIVTSHSGLS